MKAISISQPWSWLIVNGIKDVENRDWTTDYRGFLLIHAGKKLDTTILQSLEWQQKNLAMPDHWKAAWAMMPENADFETGGIVGYATLQKVVTSSESPWFRGRYGFVLTQRRTVPFIPLRGSLGLFDVSAEIEAIINEIRDQRFHDEESKEMTRIAKEWYDYRHEGDETPPWGKS